MTCCPRGFTGKVRDAESGVDYFCARYMSPAQGRFASPDLVGPDVENPQTLNKYRYALNNPLRYVDRNGEYEQDVHRDLTRVLALVVGFSNFAAERVAINTQAVDERPETNPVSARNTLNVKMRADFHFTTAERRSELWGAFEKSGSYIDLGLALHAEQDSFSHEGYGPERGHARALTAPDKTYNDAPKADRMALRTYQLLEKAAERLGQRGKVVP